MNDNISYISAFLFGFFGSIHCVGMCGSIVGLLSHNLYKNKYKNIIFYYFLYNFGRILSYCIIGLFAGLFGVVLFNFFSDNSVKVIKIISSSLMIIFGIYTIFSLNFNFLEKLNYLNFSFFNNLGKKFILLPSPYKDLLLGMLWGNIPCGFVYSAICFSIIIGSIPKSMLSMFFFGIGTMPAMMLTSIAYSKIKIINKYIFFKRILGFIIIFFGVYTLINIIYLKNCHFLQ